MVKFLHPIAESNPIPGNHAPSCLRGLATQDHYAITARVEMASKKLAYLAAATCQDDAARFHTPPELVISGLVGQVAAAQLRWAATQR